MSHRNEFEPTNYAEYIVSVLLHKDDWYSFIGKIGYLLKTSTSKLLAHLI